MRLAEQTNDELNALAHDQYDEREDEGEHGGGDGVDEEGRDRLGLHADERIGVECVAVGLEQSAVLGPQVGREADAAEHRYEQRERDHEARYPAQQEDHHDRDEERGEYELADGGQLLIELGQRELERVRAQERLQRLQVVVQLEYLLELGHAPIAHLVAHQYGQRRTQARYVLARRHVVQAECHVVLERVALELGHALDVHVRTRLHACAIRRRQIQHVKYEHVSEFCLFVCGWWFSFSNLAIF